MSRKLPQSRYWLVTKKTDAKPAADKITAAPNADLPDSIEETAKLQASVVSSGTCGAENAADLFWILYEDGTLQFEGSGAMKNYSSYYLSRGYSTFYASDDHTTAPWYQYRSSVKKIIVRSGVTTIGAFAFFGYHSDYHFSNLKEVELPDSLTAIGDYAFSCCAALGKITIPDHVINIGTYAFYNCPGLTAVTIPKTVTAVGSGAFANCTNLTLNVYSESAGRVYALTESIRHEIVGKSGVIYTASGTCGAKKGSDLYWKLTSDGVLEFEGWGIIRRIICQRVIRFFTLRMITQPRLGTLIDPVLKK